MRRFLITVSLCLAFACACFAQATDASAPASKEDVQRLLDAMQARNMVRQMVDVMSKPLHQMTHDNCVRNQANLPADCEERLNRFTDEMFRQMPFDEMLQAMVPAYEKHLSKGDVDAMVAFYSSPTGQKLIHELPAITAEAMENMMPVMRTYMDNMNARVQAEIAEMKKEAQPKAPPKHASSN
jgi:hypothetical protein